jgi:hypothetical protein
MFSVLTAVCRTASVLICTGKYGHDVLDLSVTTLDALLTHTFIPPSHSNPFTSLFFAFILPQLLHTPQPSRLPNRELYFT